MRRVILCLRARISLIVGCAAVMLHVSSVPAAAQYESSFINWNGPDWSQTQPSPDCHGNCGAGCSNAAIPALPSRCPQGDGWLLEPIGSIYKTGEFYQEECRWYFNEELSVWTTSMFRTFFDIVAQETVFTYRGWWDPYCEMHDSWCSCPVCCWNGFLPCCANPPGYWWDNVCNGLQNPENWGYTGAHTGWTTSVTTPDENLNWVCCVDGYCP